MKQYNFVKLACLALSAAVLMGACGTQPKTGPQPQGMMPQGMGADQMGADMDAFYNSLSSDAKKKFEQLDEKHQMGAMEMAKPKGGAAAKDPNKAVEEQYKMQMGSAPSTKPAK